MILLVSRPKGKGGYTWKRLTWSSDIRPSSRNSCRSAAHRKTENSMTSWVHPLLRRLSPAGKRRCVHPPAGRRHLSGAPHCSQRHSRLGFRRELRSSRLHRPGPLRVVQVLPRGGGPPQKSDLTAVWSHKISPQHQTSTALSETCGRNLATQSLLRSLFAVSTSTPKPRAEGSSPSAPAKKTSTAFAVLVFFVMVVGETEARGAWRGALAAGGGRQAPTEPAGETESVPLFSPSLPDFRIRLRLSSPALIPSSTQNAPGFAFFGLFRVRFCVFRPFNAQNY